MLLGMLCLVRLLDTFKILDQFKHFLSVVPPPVCSPNFSFMGEVGKTVNN
jgi:hypothetical protein